MGNYQDPKRKRRGRTPRRRPVGQHVYVNAQGRPHMRIVRFEPKDFAAYRPDGHGEWLPGAPDELVLYRLHDLMTADKDEPVHVFEGERKADVAAEKWGLLTTCSPFGAAGKWEARYSETLRRLDTVYIHADNDATGREHATQVARSLLRARRAGPPEGEASG